MKINSLLGHNIEDYPEFELWSVSRHLKELQILNEVDFPKDEILKSLEIDKSDLVSTFGIADENEISERLALTKFLAQNPDFMKWIEKVNLNFTIPSEATEFMDFFDPNLNGVTPYWKTIETFLNHLKDKPLPRRLKQIVELIEDKIELRTQEWCMGSTITEDVEKITTFEGCFEIRVNINSDGSLSKLYSIDDSFLAYGYKNFSHALNLQRMKIFPEWVNNPRFIAKWTGLTYLTKFWVNWSNDRKRKKAYRKQAILEIPSWLKKQIVEYAQSQIKEVKRWSKELSGGSISVYFSFDRNGLRIRFYDIELSSSILKSFEKGFEYLDFEGLNFFRKWQLKKASDYMKTNIKYSVAGTIRDRIRHSLEAQKKGFFTDYFFLDETDTASEYRWCSISNHYGSKKWQPVYNELLKHRKFVSKHLSRLKQVVVLVKQIQKKAHELNVPVCYPEIVDGSHVVDFEEIYPIQLLFRLQNKQPRPISLPTLNGSIICLTGKHGGGKTETQLGTIANIYLAQSGLPVLGRAFRFNVKKVLGLVFVTQRGQGSTVEILIEKIKTVLKGIKSVNPKEVVLVLDEIGTGTQEASGYELGRDLLTSLADKGVSVIFSTQITDLATYAKDNLEAVCCWVDKNHNFQLGISDGGLMELRIESGLQNLLRL